MKYSQQLAEELQTNHRELTHLLGISLDFLIFGIHFYYKLLGPEIVLS